MASELDLTRLAELRDLLGIEPGEIVATLLRELTSAVAEIERSLTAGDLEAAALAAHAARNSALMIDAKPALDVLSALESGARGGDLEVALAALERLRESWPPLRRQLEQIARGDD